MENIEIANQLFEDLRRVFDEVLDQNTWLEGDLKTRLKKELKAIKSSLGIPDEHKDLSNIDRMYARVEKEQKVEDQSYLTLVRNLLKMNSEETFLRVARMETITYEGRTLQGASTFFDGSHRISIAPLLLNSPYIDRNLPKWSSIASIGNAFAHEMGHSFDASSYFMDKTQVPYPMSEAMKNEFNQRIDCIVQKYDKFKFPDGTNANGERTKLEDSADMIGLNVAYKLFKKLGGQQKLPAFQNQTIEQTFFHAVSLDLCGKKLTGPRLKLLKEDEHSISRFRVNGMMSNSVDFAKAFGCKKGSPMNPEKKCPLF